MTLISESDTSLADFIRRKLTELGVREEALRAMLAEIERERGQLVAAALATNISIETDSANPVEVIHQESVAQQDIEPAQSTGEITRRRPKAMTMKDATVAVLQAHGRGLTALEILEKMNSQFGWNYERSSLSPQLSRLKSEGKLTRNGQIWSLAAAETNEAPADGNPLNASEPEVPGDDTLPDFIK